MLYRPHIAGLALLAVVCVTAGGSETRDGGGPGLPKVEIGEAALPVGTELVASDHGDLSYVAEDCGVPYLYDNQEKQVVHIQQVGRGERFSVAPERNLATLDGRPLVWKEDQPRVRDGRVHQIYFLRL